MMANPFDACDDFIVREIVQKCTFVAQDNDSYYREYIDPWTIRAFRMTCRRFAQMFKKGVVCFTNFSSFRINDPNCEELRARVNVICYMRHMMSDIYLHYEQFDDGDKVVSLRVERVCDANDVHQSAIIEARLNHFELVLREIMCNRTFDETGFARADLIAFRERLFAYALKRPTSRCARIIAHYLWDNDKRNGLAQYFANKSMNVMRDQLTNAITRWGEAEFARFCDDKRGKLSFAEIMRSNQRKIDQGTLTINQFLEDLHTSEKVHDENDVDCVIAQIIAMRIFFALPDYRDSNQFSIDNMVYNFGNSSGVFSLLDKFTSIDVSWLHNRNWEKLAICMMQGLVRRELFSRENMIIWINDIRFASVAYHPRDRKRIPFLRERLREEFGIIRAQDCMRAVDPNYDDYGAIAINERFGNLDDARKLRIAAPRNVRTIGVDFMCDFLDSSRANVLAQFAQYLAQTGARPSYRDMLREIWVTLGYYHKLLYAQDVIDIVTVHLLRGLTVARPAQKYILWKINSPIKSHLSRKYGIMFI